MTGRTHVYGTRYSRARARTLSSHGRAGKRSGLEGEGEIERTYEWREDGKSAVRAERGQRGAGVRDADERECEDTRNPVRSADRPRHRAAQQGATEGERR